MSAITRLSTFMPIQQHWETIKVDSRLNNIGRRLKWKTQGTKWTIYTGEPLHLISTGANRPLVNYTCVKKNSSGHLINSLAINTFNEFSLPFQTRLCKEFVCQRIWRHSVQEKCIIYYEKYNTRDISGSDI